MTLWDSPFKTVVELSMSPSSFPHDSLKRTNPYSKRAAQEEYTDEVKESYYDGAAEIHQDISQVAKPEHDHVTEKAKRMNTNNHVDLSPADVSFLKRRWNRHGIPYCYYDKEKKKFVHSPGS
ncbi:hypothetical protein WICPIJ_007923 [Wickerhamomyces pijperi]|uniref:Uncharacterized protein n=1 Tax=Wickerhamomyces pijperi TaxID=599730 RepID=A0A9P8PZ22_WICPI|nr:hypothetical protein WICPIJ_007923 [Wickerhamomyces pijperi]